MVEPHLERVMLELCPGEPISGRIFTAGETAQPFRGWLELAGKLERIRTPVTPAQEDRSQKDR
jgi:hypothetical protein